MKIPQHPPTVESYARVLEILRRGADDEQLAEVVVFGGSPLDQKGRYLHWDEMRHRAPPPGLDHLTWWFSTNRARHVISRELPLTATDGTPFRFCNVDPIQEMVHRIDQQASGQILASDVVTSLRSSDRYLVSSLAEEAITSSQLEGASTTRRVAKELLASGRPPRDRGERMIVNNYQAMSVAQELSNRELTTADVLDLHRTVADGALDNPADAGRLQSPDDERVAVWWNNGVKLHQPPPAEELPQRLDAMCRFANGASTEGFIHPVVRAIILHFWLAYDHPFSDGNGRTARALFYWSMLHSGYWLFQYISVSSILGKAPVQYTKSYLYTETDGNDLTYFVLYNLQVIERAIKSLHDYLARKIDEMKEVEALLHGSPHLNHRQLVVVRDALREHGKAFTVATQMRTHNVAYESARSDLLDLEGKGLLTKQRVGKKLVFHAVDDLADRLREVGSSPQ